MAFSASLAALPVRKTVSEGALGFLEILMISLSLGTPSVTFLEDTPAKWKVFKVICVAGSPILWAAMAPTISPGATCAHLNLETGTSILNYEEKKLEKHDGDWSGWLLRENAGVRRKI